MIENKGLLKGITLIEIENNDTIELSFYDKQHGIISDYPCINTCIMDDAGEWFTTTYFEAETPQNADSVYKECEFL